mmetsp:Transcript_13659/g.32039  ORF Transcript_13659/g.32039 Transcript_13659/m.32039 type:complete len:197 (+) Transcript_13659:255-845(+)|eukprot:CAMPEP_0197175726 /NCGR_PEP_ID=MMETSP1423-20130617/1870_1 /TAXON_ID=476441 /ORGANISM="Pseudo-nitzschia heimii, Strain UNC1101" /LENGTH=196 /DNA_ID=CAMNT_0042624955 /DNA_START=452 /DNA_END=1042 /DNA_ORIENTATION=+
MFKHRSETLSVFSFTTPTYYFGCFYGGVENNFNFTLIHVAAVVIFTPFSCRSVFFAVENGITGIVLLLWFRRKEIAGDQNTPYSSLVLHFGSISLDEPFALVRIEVAFAVKPVDKGDSLVGIEGVRCGHERDSKAPEPHAIYPGSDATQGTKHKVEGSDGGKPKVCRLTTLNSIQALTGAIDKVKEIHKPHETDVG